MPGVLVIERRGTQAAILMRFGSEANRTDMQAIESTYTILEVHLIGKGGFSGTWRSGLLDVHAQGHFCATRIRS
jgi:hypothetical protein